jgi:hypothetical protein
LRALIVFIKTFNNKSFFFFFLGGKGEERRGDKGKITDWLNIDIGK